MKFLELGKNIDKYIVINLLIGDDKSSIAAL